MANVTYHVHTTPDLVSAKENCAPHSIWQTPWPFSRSMFWGMLHPSLPPRPSFPKSPSPQENTKPNKHQIAGQTMITVLPCARRLLKQDTPTFICQSKSLSISASTRNLNDSVAKEHFNLQNRRSKKEVFKEIMFKNLTNVSKVLWLILDTVPSLSKEPFSHAQNPTLLHGSFHLCIKRDAGHESSTCHFT